MVKFTRRLDPRLFSQLATPLYENHLLGDIKSTGEVFPAIRHNRVDFYYRGGRLFRLGTNGFQTHYKYIPSIQYGSVSKYVTNDKLRYFQSPISFEDENTYKRIKELCDVYAGEEAHEVTKLYRHFHYLFPPDSLPDIIPLDIEICFHADDDNDDRKFDRIDILFLNTVTKTLRFAEVKRFSDSRLYASGTNIPKVVTQLSRYTTQLSKRSEEIIDAYSDYVEALNNLFTLNIPKPIAIEQKSIFLFITGFDDEQRKVVQTVKNDLHGHGIACYAIGNAARCNLLTMWKAI